VLVAAIAALASVGCAAGVLLAAATAVAGTLAPGVSEPLALVNPAMACTVCFACWVASALRSGTRVRAAASAVPDSGLSGTGAGVGLLHANSSSAITTSSGVLYFQPFMLLSPFSQFWAATERSCIIASRGAALHR
jgi:hypothetical protein